MPMDPVMSHSPDPTTKLLSGISNTTTTPEAANPEPKSSLLTVLLSDLLPSKDSLTFGSPLTVHENRTSYLLTTGDNSTSSNMTINSIDRNDDWDDWKGWNVINFSSLTSLLASGGIIFGGVIPYVPQYMEIKRTQNSSGFSTYVCLALIAANTLRIIFWFGKRFETPLLIQSIVMLIAMFIMMEICVRMRRHTNSATFPAFRKKVFHDLNPLDFWQWTDLLSYLECTTVFVVIIGLLMYFFMDVAWFVESVGYTSLLTESCLAMPQLYQNFRTRSTLGMSVSMVLGWAFGDLFKTGYYVIKNVPIQFIACGVIQITVDLLILTQVVFYPSAAPNEKSKNKKKRDPLVRMEISQKPPSPPSSALMHT